MGHPLKSTYATYSLFFFSRRRKRALPPPGAALFFFFYWLSSPLRTSRSTAPSPAWSVCAGRAPASTRALSFFRSGYGGRNCFPPPGFAAQPVLGILGPTAPFGSKGRWAKRYINMLGTPKQNNNKWSFGECMASLKNMRCLEVARSGLNLD